MGKPQKSAEQTGGFRLHLMSQFKKAFRHIKYKLSVRLVYNSLAKLWEGLLASAGLRFLSEKKLVCRIL